MWHEVYAELRLREKTKDYYLNYIDKHIIPELGDIKLDKLTTIRIQKFYNDLINHSQSLFLFILNEEPGKLIRKVLYAMKVFTPYFFLTSRARYLFLQKDDLP